MGWCSRLTVTAHLQQAPCGLVQHVITAQHSQHTLVPAASRARVGGRRVKLQQASLRIRTQGRGAWIPGLGERLGPPLSDPGHFWVGRQSVPATATEGAPPAHSEGVVACRRL